MNRKKIITSYIDSGSYKEFIERIIQLAKHKYSSYVCITNVHMVIEAYLDKKFNTILNHADLVAPDGMPLAKILQLMCGFKQDRVAGMDLMPDLFREAEKNGLAVYLYGSTFSMLSSIENKAKKEYPDLKICGKYSPPFRKLSEEEDEIITERINRAEADLVLVALGCPKQEKWMAEHKGKINGCMIGLGAAFAIYAGNQSRAPQWMQNACLEWFYRLLQEPRRLWKRYLVTNTLFLLLILWNALTSLCSQYANYGWRSLQTGLTRILF